ncbi:MAG: N-acetylmuramoyl-L-alanine amidase, partial [Planctomycetes bacterium]|nr:N-acetylmuramoyl-L-alanine amidase [Planctomycetota bacterium]
LEGASAQVISCRARTRTTEEHVLQNDDGGPTYSEVGSWNTSGQSGWDGSSYRFAQATPGPVGFASFQPTIATQDLYPVYVAYRSGSNRSSTVRVEVDHAGGTATREVDQTTDGLRWVYVGRFPFRSGDTAVVRILTQSSTAGVVIADAVRIGDGMGSIVRGGTTSGLPRWLECSRYHAEYFGAPSSVWNPSSGAQDNNDDVTCRPFYAEWWGADVYFSLHTNAGGGSGTGTWIHNTSPTAGSATLRSFVHPQVINDIRAHFDPTWVDTGYHSANFGELRELSTIPGVLMELAFHDDLGGDIEALHHPTFRRVAARAIYRGIASYLGAQWTAEPPDAIVLRNDGSGSLNLQWGGVSTATSYLVQWSDDAFSWSEGQVVTGTSVTLGGLVHDQLRFARVATLNGGGRGPFSEPVGARLAPGAPAPLLLVHGFDRHDRNVKEYENRHDGLVRTGAAVAAVAEAGYPFDGATNEAVISGLANIAAPNDWRCVGWILGEESTADETFSAAEQSAVTAYLAQGGRLFFSGAEVGWDLDHLGSPTDRAFYEGVLGMNYLADDAGTFLTQSTLSGPLAPLMPMLFDDGSAGIYDVDYPDVVGPSTGSGGQVVLRYVNGQGAAVLRGDGRVLGFGFPIDALRLVADRTLLMSRVLALMCPLRVPLPGPLVLGQPFSLSLDFPDSPGLVYVAAPSLTTTPGIAVGGGRVLPLADDGLLQFAFLPGQANFNGLVASLDQSGQAAASVYIPILPGFAGQSFFMSALTLGANGVVQEVAPWVRVTMQ